MEPEYGSAAGAAATLGFAGPSFTAPRSGSGGVGMTASRPAQAPRTSATTDPVPSSTWLSPPHTSSYVPPLQRIRPAPSVSGVAMYNPTQAGGGGSALPVFNSSMQANVLPAGGYGEPSAQAPPAPWQPGGYGEPSAQAAPAPWPQTAPQASLPAVCIRPQSIRDTADINNCDLQELIVLHEKLGEGGYGIVFRITVRPGANARGLPLAEDTEYALKFSWAERHDSASEAELGEVIRRSDIPLINLVPTYFWMRWFASPAQLDWLDSMSGSRRKALGQIVYLMFMQIQYGTTLATVTNTRRLVPARGPPINFDTQDIVPGVVYTRRTLFIASTTVQLCAAFAALRMIMPVFTNGDAHGNNLMLSKTGIPDGVDSILYVLPNKSGLFLPLQLTGGLVLRMLDLGLAAGRYITHDVTTGEAQIAARETIRRMPSWKDPMDLARFARHLVDLLYGAPPNYTVANKIIDVAMRSNTFPPNFYVDLMLNSPVFNLLRVDTLDRSSLDAKYLELVGVPRLSNFESMRIHIDLAGTTSIQPIQSEMHRY